MKVTQAQLKTLILAKEMKAKGFGIIPTPGQHGMFKRLALAGLLRYIGLGKCEGSDDNLMYPVYTLPDDVSLVALAKSSPSTLRSFPSPP